tara:strand:- start:1303 stop:1737 length:435 start_codon:yes stop_codon:yes gene_type:complete
MKIFFLLTCFALFIYNCSPINKQHGYLLVDVVDSAEEMLEFNIGTTSKNDVFQSLGSPSIEITDINNIWIYLISVKQKNVFENDNIVYQSILRFEFDKEGILAAKDFSNEDDFHEIAFSKDRTKVATDTYGITEQIYETFVRGQ